LSRNRRVEGYEGIGRGRNKASGETRQRRLVDFTSSNDRMKEKLNENQQLSCKVCQDRTDSAPPKPRTCRFDRRVQEKGERDGEMLEGSGPRRKKERIMGGMMAGTKMACLGQKPVPGWRFRCAR
jgi:hypothetical protein